MILTTTDKFIVEEDVQDFLKGLGLGTELAHNQFALEGKKGCGKTSLAEAIAFQLNRNFVRLDINSETSVQDLTTSKTIRNGAIIDEEQEFLRAVQTDAVILLDEYKTAQAGILAVLNSLLDGAKAITLPNGRVVNRHKDNIIICASNPETYAGVRRQHGGFIDRLPTLTMGYVKNEIDLLTKRYPKVGEETNLKLVKLAQHIREGNRTSNLQAELSTRGLMTVSHMLSNGAKLPTALNSVLRLCEDEKSSVGSMVELIFRSPLHTTKEGKLEVDLLKGKEEEIARYKRERDEAVKSLDSTKAKYDKISEAINGLS